MSELPWQTSGIDLPSSLEEMRRKAKQLARASRYGEGLEPAKLDRMTVEAMKQRLALESPMIPAPLPDVDLRHV
ncbi:MAG TPA: hypothetical protein PKA58_35610 [Polyangium sp.]|nr:hypothetical protein [Polyangium sp.]